MFKVNYKNMTFGFKNGKEVKITNVTGMHCDDFNNNREICIYLYGNRQSIQIYLDELIYIITEEW